MAQLLKGAPVAAAMTEDLIARAQKLRNKSIIPTLAIVRVGDKPDSVSYETGAMKRCDKVGIEVKRFILPEDCTENELLDIISTINSDDSIHGCLMFRPLSDKALEAKACSLLSPDKDVDCMNPTSLAGVFAGNSLGHAPCTAQACIELLDYYGIQLEGRHVVVIGRSLVIGKPVSMMLQTRNATVTMCHTKTANIREMCLGADIVLVAAGKAKTLTADCVRPGQVIIDVGINLGKDGKLCGDVDFDNVERLVSAISPVPSGVGSLTTSVLAKHVIEAAEKKA